MISVKRQNICRWAKQHHWYERARAYDQWEARVINYQTAMGVAEMRTRQAALAKEMQDKAKERLAQMQEADIKRMTPGDTAMFAKAGADIERGAREVPQDQLGFPESGNQDLPPVVLIEKREDEVTIRFSDGECGFIRRDKVDRAREMFPDAVIFL